MRHEPQTGLTGLRNKLLVKILAPVGLVFAIAVGPHVVISVMALMPPVAVVPFVLFAILILCRVWWFRRR